MHKAKTATAGQHVETVSLLVLLGVVILGAVALSLYLCAPLGPGTESPPNNIPALNLIEGDNVPLDDAANEQPH
jgi:hypothetical protein